MNLSFRHYYWRWLKNLFFLFIAASLLLTVARLGFAFYFGESAILLENLSQVRIALLLGYRYDIMPLAYINLLPFLILNIAFFFPGKLTIKLTRFLIISILCLGYFAVGWSYVFDYGFYSYFQEHLNILFFGFFEDDTMALLVSIWKNYPMVVWLSVLAIIHYGVYRVIKFSFSPFEFDLKVKRFDWRMPLAFLGGLVFLAYAGRGSFNRLPLSIEDSHIGQNEFINKLSLNGIITFNRALKIRKTFGRSQFNYLSTYGFSSWQDAYKASFDQAPKSDSLVLSLKSKTPHNPWLANHSPHVVLVVMESFGSYWNENDSDQFSILGDLKGHFKNGLLFKNFLPAENGTIGSIVSVATSQAVRPGARFLSESEYMNTPFSSSGHIPFKESGYETHFIYGGKLGWRDLGKFLAHQKFDRLWGADEIKEAMPELSNHSERDLGNEWGIFDEYLYSFIEEKINTAVKPQLFVVLTTSNHPPFEFPASYGPKEINLNDKYSQLTVDESIAKKRFYAFQYANQKIAEFITRVRSSRVKDKTIIALTGDHSFWIAKGVGSEKEFKRYSVPFYISAPPEYLPENVDVNVFGSHEDIYPTLINLSLSGQEYTRLGENLLEGNSHALNSSGLVAGPQGAYHHDRYWKWKSKEEQILEPTEETPELKKLKNHADGLIGITDAYLKEEKLKATSPK